MLIYNSKDVLIHFNGNFATQVIVFFTSVHVETFQSNEGKPLYSF